MANYEKLVKDGKVAVLISHGFGAGWYSWNRDNEALLFDKDLIELVLKGDMDELERVVESKYPGIYRGGLRDVSVEWVPQGEMFEVSEYDGSESLRLISQQQFLVA